MKKGKKIPLKIDELLYNNLTNMISIRHSVLLQTINLAMVTLFWEIGDIIKNHARHNNIKDNPEFFLIQISDILLPHFGSYFSLDNISLMKKFAENCQSDTLKGISTIVSWEYIPLLLDLESRLAWEFYANLIHQQLLTPKQLEKKILQKTFEKDKLQSNLTDSTLSSRSFKKDIIKIYFDGSKTIAFRLLFEPQADNGIKFPNNSLISDVNKEIITTVYHKTLSFQSSNNHLLNIYFNTLFWELGDEILRLFNLFSVKEPQDEIDALIKKLEQKFNSFFNKDQIDNCLTFARQFKDQIERVDFAQTVRWEHIKILLQIDDQNTQLFYAHKVLENGLNTTAMEKLIRSNLQQVSTQQLNKVEIRSDNLQEKQLKMGKKTLNITLTSIEDVINLKHDLNRNIFKNQDLINFIKVVN